MVFSMCTRSHKLQLSRHHSYFQKDFQMLLIVDEGEMWSSHFALAHPHINNNEKINLNIGLKTPWASCSKYR